MIKSLIENGLTPEETIEIDTALASVGREVLLRLENHSKNLKKIVDTADSPAQAYKFLYEDILETVQGGIQRGKETTQLKREYARN